jgi:hypothetical protein
MTSRGIIFCPARKTSTHAAFARVGKIHYVGRLVFVPSVTAKAGSFDSSSMTGFHPNKTWIVCLAQFLEFSEQSADKTKMRKSVQSARAHLGLKTD